MMDNLARIRQWASDNLTKSQAGRLASPVVELVQEGAKLRAENARLRELVSDYYAAPCVECHPWDEGWHGCKHCDGGDCTLATRAIELGIEVEQ